MLNTIDDIRRENARTLVEQIGSQAAFSRKIERQPTQVNRFIGSNYTNNIGDSMARHIEKCFYLPVGWLDQDRSSGTSISESSAFYGGSTGDGLVGCPVLSFDQVGLNLNDIGDRMPCPVAHGKDTFVLIVTGESMYSPNGSLSFKPGEYIFVDPARMPVNGDLVIAKNDGGPALFRQLIIDSGIQYIQTLNKDWPGRITQIQSSTIICGVVICRVERF